MQFIKAASLKVLALAAIILAGIHSSLLMVSAQTYIEMPLDDYVASLNLAAQVLRTEADRQGFTVALSPSPLPACKGPSMEPGKLLRDIADYMEAAASSALRGDWEAFRDAKSKAYLLVSCYPGLAYFSGGAFDLVYLLVSAEPSGQSVLVPVSVALKSPSGTQQPGGIPEIPQSPPVELPSIEPPAINVGPGEGGGIQAGGVGSSVEITGKAPSEVGVDVNRLLDMLVRAREALEETGSAGGRPALSLKPSLPSSKILLVAFAGVVAYAARGVIWAAASSAARLAGLLYSIARYRRLEVTARECYREALKSVESETGRRKTTWETPREYLNAVKKLLNPDARAWFEDKTEAYEAEVYGGHPREFRVEECARGGRLARWRLAGKR